MDMEARDYLKALRAEMERERTHGLGYARAYLLLMLYARDALLETQQRFAIGGPSRRSRSYLSEDDFKRVADSCDRAWLLYGRTPRPRPTFPALPPPETVAEWARAADRVNAAWFAVECARDMGTKAMTRHADQVCRRMCKIKSRLDDRACATFRAPEEWLVCRLFYGGIERRPLSSSSGANQGAFTGWREREAGDPLGFKKRVMAEAFGAPSSIQ
jgi:hypothetical protein